MKKIKTLLLLATFSSLGAVANDLIFDEKDPVVLSLSPHPSERNSKTRPVEILDERGFDPSVFPVDATLKFEFKGQATDAEIVVSGAILTNEAGKLNKIWVNAPSLSKVIKTKLRKGVNTIAILDLPVHTAAENFTDNRSKRKKQVGKAIGLTFKVLIKNSEVDSIQKVVNAHLE